MKMRCYHENEKGARCYAFITITFKKYLPNIFEQVLARGWGACLLENHELKVYCKKHTPMHKEEPFDEHLARWVS